MYGFQVVGFGLDCPDPSSPMLVQSIAALVTFVVLGGICLVAAVASRHLNPLWLKYGLILISVICAIIAAPFMFGLLVLTIACAGLGL